MIIEKKHKPTFHKANARYRGVTELGQYSNFVLESAHDIVRLSHLISGHEGKGINGQLNEIEDNFQAIVSGDREVGNANLFTAATLNKISEAVDVAPIENWSSLNECIITKTEKGVKLESKGLVGTVGIYTSLYVQPGQQIYIRLKVKSTTGAPTFTIGSSNIRTGPSTTGVTKTVPISANSDSLLIDHIISCKYAETIHLNINIHQAPQVLKKEAIEIEDFEIYYLDSKEISVKSHHTEIKPTLNSMYEQLYSIQ